MSLDSRLEKLFVILSEATVDARESGLPIFDICNTLVAASATLLQEAVNRPLETKYMEAATEVLIEHMIRLEIPLQCTALEKVGYKKGIN